MIEISGLTYEPNLKYYADLGYFMRCSNVRSLERITTMTLVEFGLYGRLYLVSRLDKDLSSTRIEIIRKELDDEDYVNYANRYFASIYWAKSSKEHYTDGLKNHLSLMCNPYSMLGRGYLDMVKEAI